MHQEVADGRTEHLPHVQGTRPLAGRVPKAEVGRRRTEEKLMQFSVIRTFETDYNLICLNTAVL